jgi:trimeric autotransporter adhesin
MRRSAALVGVFLLLVAAATAGAQTFTGSIRGEVKDANGVLPGATVTLLNEETNVSRETTTNDVGQYAFPAVTPGTYTVKVALTGYKIHERKGLTVATQQQVALDIPLELGAIQESITVTGESPLIETSSASTGGVLDSKVLESLPAPGRAAYLMAVTVPTVVATGDTQFNRQQDQTNASLISMGGGPRRGNNYLLDGLPITDMRNRSVVNPIIEAVDEVKVQVHTYDTEMGRTGGGIFNVAMKSGTNNFRGTAFFQTRPSDWMEQNFFSKRRGDEQPPQYYRLYGGGFGGPIVENRTFFWGALEGYRSSTTRNGEIRFPTTRERAGDFSQSPVTIYNPLSDDGNGNRLPFDGNRIPAGMINPVAAAIMNFIPLPDSDVNDGSANYSRTTSIVDQADQFTGKVEHKFTDKVSLSGVYLYNKTDEPHSVFWDDNLFGSPSWLLARRIHVLAVNNTWIPSDSTVVTFRGGWNRFDDNCSVPHDFDPGTLGFNQAFLQDIQFNKFPMILPEGYDTSDGWAGWCPRNDIQWYTYAFNGSITKLVGRHSFKAGGEFQRKGLNTQIFGQSSGRFEFAQATTAGPDPFSPASGTGDAIASFLLGYPDVWSDTNSAVISSPSRLFFNYFGGFVQDDFRVSEKLTLTYGVRFENEGGLREKDDGIVVAFDQNAVSPLDSMVNKAGTALQGRTLSGGLVYAGVNGAPTYQGDPGFTVAPRIGVVYAASARTVVRGGYGLFYAPWNYPFPSEENYGQRGFTQVTTMQQTFPRPVTTLDNPYPNGLDPITGNSAGLLTGVGGTVRFIDQNKEPSRVQQWSIDVQRELPGNMAVTIGYLGSRGDNLGLGGTADAYVNINQLEPAAMALGASLLEPVPNPFFGVAAAGGLASLETIERGQLLRPYPQFRDVLAFGVTEGKSRYHAMTLQLDKRLSRGWGGRFGYTLSRLKDNQFAETNFYTNRAGSAPQNNYDLEAEYSLGLLDVPHKLTFAPIVELPWGQGRRYLNEPGIADYIVGGWTFSAIVTFESGYPIGIGQTANNAFGSTSIGGNIQQRPNRAGGDPVNPGNITDRLDADLEDNQYLNSGAWTQTPAFTFGNSPRTDGDWRSPFRTNWDLVFNKSFRTGGTSRADVRFEILNAFNQPKYAGFASSTLGNAQFGRVTTQAGFMRIWQVSFRFAF